MRWGKIDMARDAQGQGWVSRSLEAGASGPGADASASSSTFIDQGAVFDGRLRAPGTLRLDGEFRGKIIGDSVIVGEAAGIEATIQARSVVVSGAVAGRIEASREVVLRPTARLHADVDAPSFVVERGAVLNGQTRMVRPEQRAQAEAKASNATPDVPQTPDAAPGDFATR
jgi:cytoskeletal protein CcmA (bactofilin family)